MDEISYFIYLCLLITCAFFPCVFFLLWLFPTVTLSWVPVSLFDDQRQPKLIFLVSLFSMTKDNQSDQSWFFKGSLFYFLNNGVPMPPTGSRRPSKWPWECPLPIFGRLDRGRTRGRQVEGHLKHAIASIKVKKWWKSGYNPPKTGSGGRLTSIFFKGGVELII